MPRDRNKWIETPNEFWTVYLNTGKEIRLTSVDLLEKVIDTSGPEHWKPPEQRVFGYMFSS